MEQHLKLVGIVLFGVALFLNLRIMHKARSLLTGDQLLSLQRASDPKAWTFFAGVVPLLLVYWLVGVVPNYAVAVFVAGIILSFAAIVATGDHYLRRARAAGMPEDYLQSYRKGHLIMSAGFAIAIGALAYPVMVAIHAS